MAKYTYNDREFEYSLENLRSLANKATRAQFADGMTWYDAARRISHEWAAEFNLQPITVAGVLSALSPHNKWEKNVIDARAIIIAVQNSGPTAAWKVKVSTYNANKAKAIAIASSDTIDALKGQKVRSFVHNIAHEDSQCITVDTHAFNAGCLEVLISSSGNGPSITPKRYRELSEMYHELAAELGVRGYQAQAIVWVVWREMVD